MTQDLSMAWRNVLHRGDQPTGLHITKLTLASYPRPCRNHSYSTPLARLLLVLLSNENNDFTPPRLRHPNPTHPRRRSHLPNFPLAVPTRMVRAKLVAPTKQPAYSQHLFRDPTVDRGWIWRGAKSIPPRPHVHRSRKASPRRPMALDGAHTFDSQNPVNACRCAPVAQISRANFVLASVRG